MLAYIYFHLKMASAILRLIYPKKISKQLPTKLETLRAFLYEKRKYRKASKEELSIIARVVAKQIKKNYSEAGIDTLRKDIIANQVMKIYNSRLDLLKVPRCQRYTNVFIKKMQKFESEMSETLKVTAKKKLNQNRTTQRKSNAIDIDLSDDSESDVPNTEDENDQDYDPSSDLINFDENTRKRDLSEIVEVKSRFSYSYRGTAAIVNATLKAFDIPVVIDKSKLERAEKRTFDKMSAASAIFGGGLYYDSRKDESMTHTKERDENGQYKFYRSTERQEHYSLVSQPNDLFMGFVNVKNGSAKPASEAIMSVLTANNIENDIEALGSDGMNTNVGAEGGINHFIEVAVKRPLHWFVCLLHANELPLKALIVKLDGKTTGSNSFSGPIGKAIAKIERPTIVNFEIFNGSTKLETLPLEVYNKLSNDQKYLYRIVNALVTGVFPDDLKRLKVGKLCHSRWLTTASRICLLYASSENPSETLRILTSYVVDVYAPTWFQIKKNELAVHGPKNLFFLMKRSNLIVNCKAKKIVRKCIRRNAFFAHSENVLLAQLASHDTSERNDGISKVLELRRENNTRGIRSFRVPKINFAAKSWTDMLIWDCAKMTEPPFTLKLTESEILAIKNTPLKVPRFKCHTQMVERAIKEVTRVSMKAVDQKKQESMVKATLINRAKYPKFESKKDHVAQSHCNLLTKI